MKNTNSLETITKTRKIRDGRADGTAIDGAYWNALKVRLYHDSFYYEDEYDICSLTFVLRYFRTGKVDAIISLVELNSEIGQVFDVIECSGIPECETVEDVIIELRCQGIPLLENAPEGFYDQLKDALLEYGLSEYNSGPDGEQGEPIGRY